MGFLASQGDRIGNCLRRNKEGHLYPYGRSTYSHSFGLLLRPLMVVASYPPRQAG